MALGSKLSWKIYREPNCLWCKIFQNNYLDSLDPKRILTIGTSNGGLAIWNFLWDRRKLITEHLTWKINNGK